MIRLDPVGDKCFIVTLGDRIEPDVHDRVMAATQALRDARVDAITDIVPAFASMAVAYEPALVSSGDGRSPHDEMARWISDALSVHTGGARGASRLVEIPVCYGGAFGPDLDNVASAHGLTADDVVHLHAKPEYLVYMVGFLPGFPYLGGLDPRLATPRRAKPRTHVPAGSVGIGGEQTGVYPLESPGGWHLIGRTPLRLFTASADPPTLLAMGDRVRFRPVTQAEFRDMESSTP